MSTPPKRKFVFWQYPVFPFVVGGELIRQYADGLVTVDCRNPWSASCGIERVRPVRITSLKDGRDTWVEIRALTARREKMIDKVERLYRDELKRICPSLFDDRKRARYLPPKNKRRGNKKTKKGKVT